ncbi:hypothetical protein [Streptomyces pseudovenezuelae]|uniref:hypothetical protein n=1 Tax=Streptomyces pseudovenezuelae TaxID=67350 RepID=UPI0036E70A42
MTTTLVDQITPADQVLLSSQVAAGDPDMATAYRKVAALWARTCLRTMTTERSRR